MNALGSSKVASQAQHYANSKAELMEDMSYSELSSLAKTNIAGSNYYEEVVVGNETTMPGNTNIKQRTCVVNVYEGSETTPRASLTFKRYSVSSGSSVPAGSIIPWYGNLANIPDGFALCDGKNGTPDLRDRFLVGAGNAYKLGDIGGENKHQLTIDEMPKHEHVVYSGYYGSNIYSISCDGSSYGGTFKDKHLTQPSGGNQPHENRPPYYALYYIMKLS